MGLGHAIPGVEDLMDTPRPDKTIAQLFAEFLADQEARLSPTTYGKYEAIIELYESYLERYWPGHSGKDYDAVTQAKGTYCGTYGAEDIPCGFSEFLGYFMSHKVIAGNGTMKAAGTVMKKLARWLGGLEHLALISSDAEQVGGLIHGPGGAFPRIMASPSWHSLRLG